MSSGSYKYITLVIISIFTGGLHFCMMSCFVRMLLYICLCVINSVTTFGFVSFHTQEDEDRFREGEGEEGGEEENMIDILGIQPIPAFCSRCV